MRTLSSLCPLPRAKTDPSATVNRSPAQDFWKVGHSSLSKLLMPGSNQLSWDQMAVVALPAQAGHDSLACRWLPLKILLYLDLSHAVGVQEFTTDPDLCQAVICRAYPTQPVGHDCCPKERLEDVCNAYRQPTKRFCIQEMRQSALSGSRQHA